MLNASNKVDLASRVFLLSNDPAVPAAIELAQPLSFERFTALVRSRLLAIPEMSQRVQVGSWGTPRWEKVDVDLSKHLRVRQLPEGAGYEEQRALIEALHAVPLDMNLAPWRITLIQRPGQGSIIYSQVHHVISDGRGLTELLAACADEPRDVLLKQRERSTQPRGWLEMFKQVRSDFAEIGARQIEPRTSIKRNEPVELRRVAWTPKAWAISDVRAIAQQLGGGTINDVIMAAVTGGLRSYLQSKGDEVENLTLHGNVPVDLLPRQEKLTFGNHVGIVMCTLPVSIAEPGKRFEAVRDSMRALKSGYHPQICETLLKVIGLVPENVGRGMVAGAAEQVSCYVSNMMGPTVKMHIDGIEVQDVRCHPIGDGNLGFGFAVYSYVDHLNLAVTADGAIIDDPNAVIAHIDNEMQVLSATRLPGQ